MDLSKASQMMNHACVHLYAVSGTPLGAGQIFERSPAEERARPFFGDSRLEGRARVRAKAHRHSQLWPPLFP